MPGADGGSVGCPSTQISGDTYAHLQDAQGIGDAQAVEKRPPRVEPERCSEAKTSREMMWSRLIPRPSASCFALEGLWCEVCERGPAEVLQRDYQVNVAGPSTMAALLNSLQMGFKTLAIQKRSGEVWQLLGAVKTEFDKFGQAFQAAAASAPDRRRAG